MKILFSCRAIDNMAGGVERMIISLMHAMLERGHEVELLTWDHEEAKSFYPIDNKINWHKLDIGDPVERADWRTRFKRAFKTRKLVKKIAPDAMIAFQQGTFFSLRLFTLGMRIPVVAAERNAPHRLDHTSHGRNRLFILNSLRLASHITVQCGSYREKYPEAVQKKLTVIPNPVFPSKDSSNPGETKGAKNLLSVGRLGYQKNMSALIRAFILIEKDFPDWNLLIAGEGEERANLEFLIKAKKLQDRISLPGAVSNVHELYCNSHLFCLPSLWEGFPNAIAEAMARGLPCVGFEECAGTSDLIEHKKTGLLARGNDDPESLAVELKKAMCSPDLRKKLGKNARKSISEYEPEKIFDEWEALIKEVAKE